MKIYSLCSYKAPLQLKVITFFSKVITCSFMLRSQDVGSAPLEDSLTNKIPVSWTDKMLFFGVNPDIFPFASKK